MLQNELLDAKKLVDTAENEAFEVPKMRNYRLCYAEPVQYGRYFTTSDGVLPNIFHIFLVAYVKGS
jgi:hypothetical protein